MTAREILVNLSLCDTDGDGQLSETDIDATLSALQALLIEEVEKKSYVDYGGKLCSLSDAIECIKRTLK